MYNGIINVYKEPDFTSFDVVAKMRGILHQKKIGHTGTLDPNATGVLPVCLGTATHVCDMLTDRSKEYIAELRFGLVTDTLDIWGKVLSESVVNITKETAEEAVLSFLGEYDQIPPMYSALKMNGQKLYELARQGKEVERAARKVQIEEIEVLKTELPVIRFRVVCSKGTYIRSLCDDIGQRAGCPAIMQSLQRTRVSAFHIQDAVKLSEIEKARDDGKLAELIQSVDSVFEAYPALTMKHGEDKSLMNGNKLTQNQVLFSDNAVSQLLEEQGQKFRIYDSEGNFSAVYYVTDEKLLRPEKMFLERKEWR